jgi:thiol-disulfide isomerase/thioredoxin
MRVLARWWVLAGSLGLLVPFGARAQQGSQSQELLDRLLTFKPSQQGVEYETPADKAAVAACKVQTETNPAGQATAYVIRDGQGKLLRRFANVSGKVDARKVPVLEQFGYYQDGFEVYREADLDGDRKVDECRWMNGGGTRVLSVAYQGDRVRYAWKRLSAEEASKVMVQALVSGDLALLESVIASADELQSLGLPKSFVDQAAAAQKAREEQIVALRKSLKGWDRATVWNRFDGMMPHSVPADSANGLKDDVLMYENAVVFAGPPGVPVDPEKVAYLQVPELVRLGETWKFVGLPLAGSQAAQLAGYEGIRTALFRESRPDAIAGRDPALAALEKKLADYDAKELPSVNPADPKTVVKYHYGRLAPLREILKLATRAEDQVLYHKQVVDDLATCYQTGLYPDGAKLLDEMGKVGGKVASYAAFRKILAEYAMDDGGANPLAHQKNYMTRLQQFLKDHAKSEEAPDALLQLASNHEFNGEEDEAKQFYTQLVREFADTEPGKKGVGALRRLDLVGKALTLKGAGLKGETVDVAQYRGKTVAVVFWHSGYEAVRKELPELAKVGQKHKDKGLVLVGVNLDGGERAPLDSFLRSSGLPWPQIVEPQGMDGKIANDYGILSLPTLFVVDPQGKVANRTIRTAAELDRLMEKPLAARSDETSGVK